MRPADDGRGGGGAPRGGPALGPEIDDPYAAFLGLRSSGPGVVALRIRPDLINSAGLLLGPVVFALADYSMGGALWEATGPDEWVATNNVAISFVASAVEGVVTCCSTLVQRGRATGTLAAEVRHEDDRVLATALGTFSIMRARS